MHIWDKVIDSMGNRKRKAMVCTPTCQFVDSTGTPYYANHKSNSCRSDVTVINVYDQRVTKSYPTPAATKFQATNQSLTSNAQRARAEQPKQLPTWVWSAEGRSKKQKPRNDEGVTHGYFVHHTERLTPKQRKVPETRYIVRKTVNQQRCGNDIFSSEEVERVSLVENRVEPTTPTDIACCKSKGVVPSNQHRPAFYGTIEAELAASNAAEHIAQACESIRRLRFVADNVYPDATGNLKMLTSMGNDLRSFNAQLCEHRYKDRSVKGSTKVAHFIIDEKVSANSRCGAM